MEILELSKKRESVRDYAQKAVEREKLNLLLEAANLAPSACNKQPWKFIVLESEQARARACNAVGRFPWLATAPIIIVCCIDHNQEWVRSFDNKRHGDIDIAIAVEHICLAAAEQGLGTCWVCAFDASAFAKEFNLPDNLEPAVLLPLGYPNYEGQRTKVRKELSEITEFL